MRGQILSRLRGVAGGAAPRGLGFVVGPVLMAPEPPPPPSPGARPVAPPAVIEAAGAIPDSDLRARFLAAAARYLARFQGDQAESAGSSSTTG